ncbi:phage portal protein [Schaalia sp. ZJ1691]|uniref:phage portal protein n=1 Tax=Schaalia sp. ZJ1691 TaxID=2709404 RepID=UPI0013EBA55D|nr:phage portal protein [Schaalia sp. ZJ1691]
MKPLAMAARFLGLHVRADEIPTGVVPPARGAAPAEPLTLDSVYRAVSVIQTAAKQLSIDVWRKGEQLADDEMPRLIANPAPETSTTDLIADTVASLALRGNAYWLVGRSLDNRAEAIRVLDPMECAPRINATTGARTVAWRGREYAPANLRHLRLLRVPGKAEGLGPIQACQRTIQGAHDMADYASRWTSGAGVPTGVLSTDQPLTPEQAKAAKERWNESNNLQNGVAVLGYNLNYQALSLKPSEVQFLESRAFDVLSIGRMFGIPAHMLLASIDGSSMTYQNINDASTDFIRWTVMAYLREIEDALSALLPGGTIARFNLSALLRANAKDRMETHAIAIQNGIYTAQVAAEIEGYAPAPTATTEETSE